MNKINIDTFKTILEKLLYEKHPELTDKENLLEKRSLRALNTYNELIAKGTDHQAALETACRELTSGFGFSLFQFIYELSYDFTEISDETRRNFCIEILSECQKVSDSLAYEGMEDWEAYFYFESEIAKVIQSFLNKTNGS